MSCARVLHAFGSHRQPAVTPVDLAVCLSLGQRQPLSQLLTMSPLKAAPRRHQLTGLYPSLSSSSSSSPAPSFPAVYSSSPRPSTPAPSEHRSCFRRDAGGGSGGGPSKKRVVFADTVGLALTAVRLFVSEPSYAGSALARRPLFAKLQSQQSTSDRLQRNRLRLSFPRPTLASQAPVACVQLESCNVSEHSLSGTVRVNHVSVDKAVHVRVTFDSWRSHRDIPCTFLQQQQQQQQQQRLGSSDVDIFAFDFGLPKNRDPAERVEFRVAFRPRPGAAPHWDDNGGQNYKVCVETGGWSAHQGDAYRGHPALSQQRPALWPLHVSTGKQNSADPHHLHRTLSSRVHPAKTNCEL